MSSPSVIPGQPGPLKPGEYQSGSIPNVVTFEFDRISPPSPLYVQRDDQLVLWATMDNTSSRPIFRWRHLLAPFKEGGQPTGRMPQASAPRIISRGKIEPGTMQLPAAAAPNSLSIRTVQLAEGFLFGITAIETVVSSTGRVFARASITRPTETGVSFATHSQLFSSYITVKQIAGWPGGRQNSPTDGPGYIEILGVSNPVAGADWFLLVNDLYVVRLQSIVAQFAASAAVANRVPHLSVRDSSGNVFFQSAVGTAITAGQVRAVSFAAGTNLAGASPTMVSAPIGAPLILMPGSQILVSTTGLDVSDQWSQIIVTWERWFIDA